MPSHIWQVMRAAIALKLACLSYDRAMDVMIAALLLLNASVCILLITDSRDELEMTILPSVILSNDGCEFELAFVGTSN